MPVLRVISVSLRPGNRLLSRELEIIPVKWIDRVLEVDGGSVHQRSEAAAPSLGVPSGSV